METLREKCEVGGKQLHFRLFEIYDLEDAPGRPGHDDLAREFGIGMKIVYGLILGGVLGIFDGLTAYCGSLIARTLKATISA